MKPIKITAKVVPKPKKQMQITTDFIRLDAALKLADAVQTGGHAKIVITEGEIKVNGEICTQRGRKLRKGDNFSFENTVYEIV
ncbi:MAG: RNA-binding S4 domain-containing protein [Clostridia bacterium]|nr:RNA-binding S4 domain-containing protein [Clostridia bacterium]